MTYAEAIRPVRNQLRKYSYLSVLGELSRFIRTESTARDGRMHAPWLAERLAVWVLRDDARMYGHTAISKQDLRRCIDSSWDVMNHAFPGFGPARSLHLTLRSLIMPQIPHQREQELGPFARQIDLVNQLQPTSHLYRLFEDTLGMPPTDFLGMATLFLQHSLANISRVVAADYRVGLWRIFGKEPVERFYQTMLVPRELTAQQMREVSPDEWFQPNLLYRSPFTVFNKMWFFWGRCGLDRNLGYALSDIIGRSESNGVRQTFEKLFEAYVGRTLVLTSVEVLGENEVRARFAVEGQCCDFAVLDGVDVVLLEVKNKALTHTLPANGTARDYASKLSATVRKADGQLRNVEAFVRKARPGATVHKVVITYGDLFAAETDQLFTTSADQFASDNPVYILSVDHLDRLIEAVRRGQCRFASFFEDYSRRRREPERRLLLLSELLNEKPYLGPELPARLFEIYEPFYEKLAERAQLGQKVVPL
ncbi:hypothetical protein [Burkholderia vietnamiensis]|uniref:hypothetical protein n=1 Tax=Burkholderia vietnamiensis TaxID=60552 RepID=UPI001594D467|nr:hypothetical protein [Burkholderia vietnamiensis]MCA7942787.1 hypothetical protein [Burkholderia vietnamiensis]HDR8972110.1 hypothetical protein [Burkholderia vietnamiensis]HDR9219721.1 hypothetical protein [Burkholderia vietnamiensis]